MTLCARVFITFCLSFVLFIERTLWAGSSEAPYPSDAQVRVREHPVTSKPFVSLVDPAHPDANYPFPNQVHIYDQPDYRLLDHKIQNGEIPYDGPFNDRTKVYVFAASMAAGGLLAGTLLPVAPAAGTVATGNAGLYAAASVGVTAGTAAGFLELSKPDASLPDYKHESKSEFHRIFETD